MTSRIPLSKSVTAVISAILAATLLPDRGMSQERDVTAPPAISVDVESFGKTSSGIPVQKYTVRHERGLQMELTDYGATMISLKVPDKNGRLDNVILTCADIAGYEACGSYFGCVAGRYCNRIAKGRFSIDGIDYQLAANNGPNHLHGGVVGFDKVVWKGETIADELGVGVRFTMTSRDGDEGYPGAVEAAAEYRINDKNQLLIDLFATADAPTHVNLTNHNYWNLGGAGSGTILDHRLKINAKKYLPVDETMIPTGELASVEGTPFDFTNEAVIGARIESLESTPAQGYDHCYALARGNGDELEWAAVLTDPESGRSMKIETNQPGLQFYTGNFLDGTPGSGGYNRNGALCLETQYFPDTPNRPDFPSSLLQPGDTYHHRHVCTFLW